LNLIDLDILSKNVKTEKSKKRMKVTKTGKETGKTKGTIIDNSAAIKIKYKEYILFTNQITIKSDDQKPFSSPGDSGSTVIIDNNGEPKVVGLLVGGSELENISVANQIGDVIKKLNIEIVSV
jgi:hypothetical protein